MARDKTIHPKFIERALEGDITGSFEKAVVELLTQKPGTDEYKAAEKRLFEQIEPQVVDLLEDFLRQKLPVVITHRRGRGHETKKRIWKAILKKNEDSPHIFILSDQVVCWQKNHIEIWGGSGKPLGNVKEYLSSTFEFENGDGKPIPMPKDLEKKIIRDIPPELPELSILCHLPVVTARGRISGGGEIVDRTFCTGYWRADTKAKNYSKEDAFLSRDYLAKELFSHFTFKTRSGPARAFAALLQPFVIPVIKGLTPLYVFHSVEGQAEAKLLEELISTVVGGEGFNSIDLSHSTDDVRKRIKALALRCVSQVRFLRGNEENRKLKNIVGLRNIGVKDGKYNLDIPNTALLTMAVGDRLQDPKEGWSTYISLGKNTDVPLDHDKLRERVLKNRDEIIQSCLTIIKYWAQSRGPRFEVEKRGRYGSWSKVMGSLLHVLELDGSLRFSDDFRMPSEDALMLINEWRSLGDKGVEAGELYKALSEEVCDALKIRSPKSLVRRMKTLLKTGDEEYLFTSEDGDGNQNVYFLKPSIPGPKFEPKDRDGYFFQNR